MSAGEILVVPKNGQGHLFPCMELCKHLLLRNYSITLIVDSDITSSVPPSLFESPLFQITDVSISPSSESGGFTPHQFASAGLETLLTKKRSESPSTRPVCAVIDHIMNKTQEIFLKFDIPTVIFITSGAAWAAIQHAIWMVRPDDMKPGEIRKLPGLPDEVVLNYSDLKQRRHWLHSSFPAKPRSGPNTSSSQEESGTKQHRGPPLPGQPAPWVDEVQCSTAILINTCDDLERPFLKYVSDLTGKPVYSVGPLLPEQYWQSSESLFQNRMIRPERESNYTDDEIIEWLDSKPRGSVTLISFGSEVGPSEEEYPELESGLEESTRPFIWVIQRPANKPGSDSKPENPYYPHGLANKVGDRGLIVYGWAPQLLILSHKSTAGFVSHCGWNSTVEAIVRGVPFLAWPIRGDQYYNAKLIVNYLKIGTMVCDGYPADMVKKEDIVKGIERLLDDEGIRNRAMEIRHKFKDGFPASSVASVDDFVSLTRSKKVVVT